MLIFSMLTVRCIDRTTEVYQIEPGGLPSMRSKGLYAFGTH